MKTKPFFFLLSLTMMSGTAFSASRNYCDDLIDSGSSPEQVAKCQEKYGVSEYAKEKVKKAKQDQDKADAKDVEAVKRKENLETKTFTAADLKEASFGKPFYATRGEWKFGRYVQKRLTEGESLCVFLGFEKAITGRVSQEINLAEASGKGVIVDKSWYGKVKDPEIFKEDSSNPDVWIRSIEEITCVRRKNKDLEGSDQMMKLFNEYVEMANDQMQDSHSDSDSKIDNKKRDSKKDKSSFSPAVPEWMKDGAVGK